MTTSPIPVEQFGTWLGELAAALGDLDGQSSGATPSLDEASDANANSPFLPGATRLLGSIGHSLGDASGAAARHFPVNDSHTARAVTRLRDRIIHNLGST